MQLLTRTSLTLFAAEGWSVIRDMSMVERPAEFIEMVGSNAMTVTQSMKNMRTPLSLDIMRKGRLVGSGK